MGFTERDGVLWSRLWMFLNNGPEGKLQFSLPQQDDRVVGP